MPHESTHKTKSYRSTILASDINKKMGFSNGKFFLKLFFSVFVPPRKLIIFKITSSFDSFVFLYSAYCFKLYLCNLVIPRFQQFICCWPSPFLFSSDPLLQYLFICFFFAFSNSLCSLKTPFLQLLSSFLLFLVICFLLQSHYVVNFLQYICCWLFLFMFSLWPKK